MYSNSIAVIHIGFGESIIIIREIINQTNIAISLTLMLLIGIN